MNIAMHHVWFGNPLSAYVTSVVFLIVGWMAVWVFQFILLKRLENWAKTTETTMDDLIIRAVERTVMPLIYVSVLMAAVKSLALPVLISRSLSILWATVVTIAVVRVILGVLRHFIYEVWLKQRPDQASLERNLHTLMPILNIAVWGMGLILLMDNLGVKVTAIVASLGIGGIAIALAAQAVLGDLFGYVVIMLDKPFEIDDAIVTGDFQGTIERIGIKTTRIRSVNGEQLIMSNKDLTDSRIRNFKRMEMRRMQFKLGLTYNTSSEKIKRAVEIVKEAIQKAPKTKLDRVHFSGFADSSLTLEAAYLVLSADYGFFMDTQQAINLKVKEEFEREKIEFAFPTQTIYVAKENSAYTPTTPV